MDDKETNDILAGFDEAMHREEKRQARRDRYMPYIATWFPKSGHKLSRGDMQRCEGWNIWTALKLTIALLLNRKEADPNIYGTEVSYWDAHESGYAWEVTHIHLHKGLRYSLNIEGDTLI